jgi:hypothetical protein
VRISDRFHFPAWLEEDKRQREIERDSRQEVFKADLVLAQTAVEAFGSCLGPMSGLRSKTWDPEKFFKEITDGRQGAAIAATHAISVHNEPALREICEELLTLLSQTIGQLRTWAMLRDQKSDIRLMFESFQNAFEFLPRGYAETLDELQAAVRATRADKQWKRPYPPYFERMKAKGFDFYGAMLILSNSPENRAKYGTDLTFR